jgi:hemolysin D
MNALAHHWDIIRTALAEERARDKPNHSVEETTFLPAALEIIEKPVSPTARATTWVLLAALVFVTGWLVLGKVDVVATASGQLVPAGNVKLIQPAQDGIVRAILVADGQKVRKGQPLVDLDPTVSTAEAVQAQRALETAEIAAARSRAIISALDGNGLKFIPPPGVSADVISSEIALAQAQLQEMLAKTATQNSARAEAAAAMGEAKIQVAKLTETLPLLDEQIDANEKLLSKGFVSKLKVIEMRRQRLSAARDRDIAVQTARKAAAQMAAAGSGIEAVTAEARSKVFGDLTDAEAEIKLRREELVKAQQRSTLQRLRSPVEGTVTQLAVYTVGGVVQAGKPIMVIVPSGDALVADVKVLNRDVGFIHEGQAAALKLEAFPFVRYGTIEGTVQNIASDAVADDKLGEVFPVRIVLDSKSPDARSNAIRPTAGMALTADIRTGQRTLLSYLVSPIEEARLNAGRER